MANIHVEPKKQPPATLWIWIVVVLVIAALAYFVATRNRATNSTTAPATTTGAIVLPAHLLSWTASG